MNDSQRLQYVGEQDVILDGTRARNHMQSAPPGAPHPPTPKASKLISLLAAAPAALHARSKQKA